MNPIRLRRRGGGKRSRRPTTETDLDCKPGSTVEEVNFTIPAPSEKFEDGKENSRTSYSTKAQATVSTHPSRRGLNLPTESNANLKLSEAFCEPAAAPSSLKLCIDNPGAVNLSQRVESHCSGWFDEEQLAEHGGIRAACQRVVEAIYAENNWTYSVFMADSKLSPGIDCCGVTHIWGMHDDDCVWNKFGPSYQGPLILGRREWTLFVFEISMTRPKFFTLCYNQVPKYNEQQVEPEVFGKSRYGHNFCDDKMITLSGGFSYPKSYVFEPVLRWPELDMMLAKMYLHQCGTSDL